MPYNCAKAVCATFCHNIAGALIPIFGPAFPSQCIPPDSPEYGRMIISPRITAEAAREAELRRRSYLSNFTSAGYHSGGSSPKRDHRKDPKQLSISERRVRAKARLGCVSPYSTDTDGDGHRSGPDTGSSTASLMANGYMYTSMTHHTRTSTGWTAANHAAATGPSARSNHHQHQHGYIVEEPPARHEANPWLSAVPRFAPPSGHHHHHHILARPWSAKRPMVSDEADPGYEGGESHNGSSPATSTIATLHRREGDRGPSASEAEKKAAELLMGLSMQDQDRVAGSRVEGGNATAIAAMAAELHRSKRRRATSM